MDASQPTVDELRIARFLTPRRSGNDQAALLTYLLNNPEALEVMCMALEALSAVNYQRPTDSSPNPDTPSR